MADTEAKIEQEKCPQCDAFIAEHNEWQKGYCEGTKSSNDLLMSALDRLEREGGLECPCLDRICGRCDGCVLTREVKMWRKAVIEAGKEPHEDI